MCRGLFHMSTSVSGILALVSNVTRDILPFPFSNLVSRRLFGSREWQGLLRRAIIPFGRAGKGCDYMSYVSGVEVLCIWHT
jgi:hypothetical protein